MATTDLMSPAVSRDQSWLCSVWWPDAVAALFAWVVGLVAATLTVAAVRPGASLGPETAGMALSPPPDLVDSIRRHPTVPNAAWASMVPGSDADSYDGSQIVTAASGDRFDRIVLLDGSDRWRSLLLGAPPPLA